MGFLTSKSNKRKNKKGLTTIDVVFLLIMLMAFALGSIVIYKAFYEINEDLQLEPEADLGNNSKAFVQDLVDRTPATLDAAFLVILIFFWIFLLVSSYLIDSHPVFFIISIVLLIAAFLIGMILSNAFNEITTDTELSTFAASFPITNYVMNHLLVVVIAIGFSVALVLYAKSQRT